MDETPKLFLETSLPTSASPYPSPSSAFYPPPIPASHEFANKLATLAGNKRYRGSGGAAPPAAATPSSNGNALSPSSASSSRRGSTSSGPSPLSQEASSKSPTTPTPAPALPKPSTPSHDRNSQRLSLGPLPPSTLSLPPATPTTANPPSNQTTPSKRTSQILEALTPIRAAPPSPAPSRRGSLIRRGSSRRWSGAGQSIHGAGAGTADSTTSSMVSEDGSTSGDVPEIAASKRASRRLSAFNALAALEPTVEGQVVNFGAAAATPKEVVSESAANAEETTPAPELESVEPEASDSGTAAKPILVADFAFPEDDVRFSKRPLELLTRAERTALGPGSSPVPRPEDDEEWDEGPEDDEWSAVWLAGARPIDGEGITPRFGNPDSNGNTNDGAGGEVDPDSPLPPGIYRALYAFEAEGTAEMSLTEGQLVRVVGRGGGVGWAVAERGWTEEGDGQATAKEEGDEETMPNEGSGALGLAGQALVPEGYLEIWKLDGEEW